MTAAVHNSLLLHCCCSVMQCITVQETLAYVNLCTAVPCHATHQPSHCHNTSSTSQGIEAMQFAHCVVCCALQVVAASRRVMRKEVSVSTAVAAVCEKLGVYDSSGNAVDEEAAASFKTLLARLLLRSDKDIAVRLAAAVLPFVEDTMTGLDTSCYPTESGARSDTSCAAQRRPMTADMVF